MPRLTSNSLSSVEPSDLPAILSSGLENPTASSIDLGVSAEGRPVSSGPSSSVTSASVLSAVPSSRLAVRLLLRQI